MRFFAVLAVAALCGCASQVMEGYVGKDIREAILDYGPPVNEMDMPDGTRAFQWKMQGDTVMTAFGGYGTVTGIGSTSTCVYTLFAERNAAKSWTVTGYRKPTLDCE